MSTRAEKMNLTDTVLRLYSVGTACLTNEAAAGKKARMPAGSAIYSSTSISISTAYSTKLTVSVSQTQNAKTKILRTHRTPKRSHSFHIPNRQTANNKRSRSLLDLIVNQSFQHRNGETPLHFFLLVKFCAQGVGVDGAGTDVVSVNVPMTAVAERDLIVGFLLRCCVSVSAEVRVETDAGLV
jgi:hypothetical protein